jgi:hypothetical protein
MGDVGDYWRDHKAWADEQKAKRHAKVPEVIKRAEDAGLHLHHFSNEHIRVNDTFDWWPSTGYWKALHGKKRGHGVASLIVAARERSTP